MCIISVVDTLLSEVADQSIESNRAGGVPRSCSHFSFMSDQSSPKSTFRHNFKHFNQNTNLIKIDNERLF